MKTLFSIALLLSCAGAASAESIPVFYVLNLGSGTINGSNLTDILIMDGSATGQVNLDFPVAATPSSGIFALLHFTPFQPTTSLIVGLDRPSGGGGDDDKTHLIFFTNQEFANSTLGLQFSTVFPGIRHSEFIDRLLAAEGGDSAQQAWFADFFQNEGHSAAFATGTMPAGIEFSISKALANAPEPVNLSMVGAGLVLIAGVLRARRTARR